MATLNSHLESLQKLCRFCGEICKEKKYNLNEVGGDGSLKYEELVFKSFLLDIKRDDEEIHPSCFCRKCHATMLNIVKRGSTSKKLLVKWMPHEEECSTCLHSSNLSVAGRKKG